MNSLLLATALLSPAQSSSFADDPSVAEQAFREGVEVRGDSAKAKPLFAKAAAGLDAIWRNGAHSPTVALARGRSHFLAGNVPMAVIAFHEGLRESPYDLQLQRGLEEVRASLPFPTPAKPDERLRPPPPAGWRHRVSEWDVFRFAAVSALLLVVGLARRFTVRDGWAMPVVAIGGVGLLAVGAVSWKLRAEEIADAARPLVVLTADETLRKGNGRTHPPRIDAALPRGTELRELARRGGWVQVEVAGGAAGWVPEAAVISIP